MGQTMSSPSSWVPQQENTWKPAKTVAKPATTDKYWFGELLIWWGGGLFLLQQKLTITVILRKL
jgi:hypothetical protein